jgi:hypothetical protein
MQQYGEQGNKGSYNNNRKGSKAMQGILPPKKYAALFHFTSLHFAKGVDDTMLRLMLFLLCSMMMTTVKDHGGIDIRCICVYTNVVSDIGPWL